MKKNSYYKSLKSKRHERLFSDNQENLSDKLKRLQNSLKHKISVQINDNQHTIIYADLLPGETEGECKNRIRNNYRIYLKNKEKFLNKIEDLKNNFEE